MRQGEMIAMALLVRPAMLLADAPRTALDGTMQAQVLEEMAELGRETAMAIARFSHDLGVVAGICNRGMVLHGGRQAACHLRVEG